MPASARWIVTDQAERPVPTSLEEFHQPRPFPGGGKQKRERRVIPYRGCIMQPFSSIDGECRTPVRLQQNRSADGRKKRSAHADKQHWTLVRSQFTKPSQLSLNGVISGVCRE